jgi:hypothetical protein
MRWTDDTRKLTASQKRQLTYRRLRYLRDDNGTALGCVYLLIMPGEYPWPWVWARYNSAGLARTAEQSGEATSRKEAEAQLIAVLALEG